MIAELVDSVEQAKRQDPPLVSAANKALELLGKHVGMWRVEDDQPRHPDTVPLEERLAGYLREETIEAAANVERMRPG